MLFSQRWVVQQVFDSVVLGGQDAGKLGSVHNTASTHGHNKVSSAGLIGVYQCLSLRIGGLGRQVIQNHTFYPGSLNLRHGIVQQASPLDPFVGKDGNFFHTVGL